MVLRMKNFNILGFHWKTVCWFKGGLARKKGGGVFEGGGLMTPMHTICLKLAE